MGWNGSIYAGSARVGREMLRLWLLLGLALVKVEAYKNLAASYVTYDYYDSSYYAYYNNPSWYCSPSVGYADTCGPTCNSPESTWVFSPVCGTGCCGPQASDPGKLIDGNTSSKLILESLLVCDWENTFTFSFISPVTPKAIYIYLPNSAHSPVTTGECQVSVAYSDTQEEIYTGFNPVTLVQPNTWTYGTYAYYGFSTTISSMYWTVVLPGVTPSQKLPLCIAEMGFALASCPNNSVSGSNLFCTCNIGYYGTNGSAPCVACPAGYYQNSTKVTACIACPVASYQSSTASTGCVQCPTGYSTMTPGSPACQACSPGTYRSQPQTPCISCSVGTYQPNAQSTFCISCGVGSYQGTVGSSSCVSCPPGYFGNTSGASVCQLCPVGKYFNGTNATSCMACVAGKFTNTSGTASCAPCPTGSYQNATQATLCLMCPPTTAALVCLRVPCVSLEPFWVWSTLAPHMPPATPAQAIRIRTRAMRLHASPALPALHRRPLAPPLVVCAGLEPIEIQRSSGLMPPSCIPRCIQGVGRALLAPHRPLPVLPTAPRVCLEPTRIIPGRFPACPAGLGNTLLHTAPPRTAHALSARTSRPPRRLHASHALLARPPRGMGCPFAPCVPLEPSLRPAPLLAPTAPSITSSPCLRQRRAPLAPSASTSPG